MHREEGPELDAFFHPRGVAIVGASRDPDRPSHQILRNMTTGCFAGPVFPINPHAPEILGQTCYPDLLSIPGPVELVVMAARAETLDSFLADLTGRQTRRGDVKALAVVSAGFGEEGTAEGAARKRRLLEACRRLGIRMAGPNCIGVVNTHTGVDTTFLLDPDRRPGSVSFVTQSGSMVVWMYSLWAADPSAPALAKAVSLGNAADVDMAEAITFLGQDPQTAVLGLYVEGTPRARRLLNAIAGAGEHKPVVVLKGGRYSAGEAAAATHTGALAGAGAIWDGALRQAGALVADNAEEFSAFLTAAERLWPQLGAASRAAVMTSAGGPGVQAMDALFGEAGLPAARFSQDTLAALTAILPPYAGIGRPDGYVDYTASASAAQQGQAVLTALRDPGVDLVLSIVLPAPGATSAGVGQALVEALAAGPGKPVLFVSPPGPAEAPGRQVLTAAGYPVFPSITLAARAVRALMQYRSWQDSRGWTRPWREVAL